MTQKEISVLVVDDSPSARELLAYIITGESSLKIIGFAENGEKALEFLKTQRPDVITMDIMMPKLDGIETTRRIMQTTPIPIVVISSISKEEVHKSFKAMEAGCVAVLEKPKGPLDPNFKQTAKSIIDTIKTMADIKLVTQRKSAPPVLEKKVLPISDGIIEAVAIGSSLGGPQALQTILSQLPETFPVPIFIVQHISNGFTSGLVEWLNGSSKLKVKLGEHGYQAQPGEVIIAPDKLHLEVGRNRRVILSDVPPVNGLKPAVARLMESMADIYGPHGIGIILTGMGRDGAKELLYMREKGGLTIAQDEEGCIMFGMPKEAISLGAAMHIVQISNMARVLSHFVSSSYKSL